MNLLKKLLMVCILVAVVLYAFPEIKEAIKKQLKQ